MKRNRHEVLDNLDVGGIFFSIIWLLFIRILFLVEIFGIFTLHSASLVLSCIKNLWDEG